MPTLIPTEPKAVMPLPQRLRQVLVCPYCGAGLRLTVAQGGCEGCDATYPVTSSGSLDLRLRRPKRYQLSLELGAPLPKGLNLAFAPMMPKANPEVDFDQVAVPFHLSREMLSYFPRARSASSLMLDLGCGGAIHRDVAERAGFQYVGLDYDSPAAPLLGDAHALPFADDSFEFVLSIAVLEHIRYPLVMMEETYRVLQPGGTLLGTVAFLEPFHLNSYYHHTHLGTLNSLQHAGFDVEIIAPNPHWTGLRAQAFMSLFRRMPRWMVGGILAPTQGLHRLWRHVTRPVADHSPVRDTTGSFAFVARKP